MVSKENILKGEFMLDGETKVPIEETGELDDEITLYGSAIKEVLKSFLKVKSASSIPEVNEVEVERRNYSSAEIDLSQPQIEDMRAIADDTFEISNLIVKTPEENPDIPSPQFHFYIGKTEVHMMGRAGEEVFKMSKQG